MDFKRRRELLALRRKLCEEAVEMFSKVTQLLHPKIEQKARKLAAYGISAGGTTRTSYRVYSELEPDNASPVPLAESIPALLRVAYEEGLRIDPLKKEMDRRIGAKRLNPYDVAKQIREALKKPTKRMETPLKEDQKT